MPERNRLARIMIVDQIVTPQERRQVVEDLCSLASQDCTTICLPGEKPINGVYPVQDCKVEMQR